MLGSKIRQNILNLFFSNQEKQYYTREIARIIGNNSIGNVYAELKKLVSEEILTTSRIGNLRLYQLNSKYFLYNELASIIAKTVGVIGELKKVTKEINGLVFAFIFGSYAKGEFKSSSDIDLFLVGKFDELELVKTIQKAEEKINRTIDFHYADQVEFIKKFGDNFFYRDIIQGAILLTENEDEFKEFIGEASKRGENKKANYRLYKS